MEEANPAVLPLLAIPQTKSGARDSSEREASVFCDENMTILGSSRTVSHVAWSHHYLNCLVQPGASNQYEI